MDTNKKSRWSGGRKQAIVVAATRPVRRAGRCGRGARNELNEVIEMRRVTAFVLMLLMSVPSAFAGAAAPATTGSVAGTASDPAGKALANATVNLRDLTSGQLAGTTTSNAAGQFSFAGLAPGNYAVEIVNAAGEIVATSAPITVAAGAAVTGVSVTAAGMAGALAGGSAIGSFLGSTLGIITLASGLGIAGVTAARGTASPSR
jgi:uncharacterized surface anchored protein